MSANADKDIFREMLEGEPLSVRAEWQPPSLSPSSTITIRTLAVGDVAFRTAFWTERAKAILVCEGPDGKPWVAGVAVKERTRWGIRQRGAIVLGDTRAIIHWAAGHEQMDIPRVGIATRRELGIAFLWHPPCEYTVAGGSSVAIRVPGLFSTEGLSRWQFDLSGVTGSRVQLRASALRGWIGTTIDSVGLERTNPRGLVTTDRAGFPVLRCPASLGSPILSGAAAEALDAAPEPLRLLAVMSVIWERMRPEGSGGGG